MRKLNLMDETKHLKSYIVRKLHIYVIILRFYVVVVYQKHSFSNKDLNCKLTLCELSVLQEILKFIICYSFTIWFKRAIYQPSSWWMKLECHFYIYWNKIATTKNNGWLIDWLHINLKILWAQYWSLGYTIEFPVSLQNNAFVY